MIELFLFNLWQVLLELSPSLLLGLIIAGLLAAYLPKGLIQRNTSKPNFSSVWWAAMIGVPMPLCSCGVLPAAIAMRNQGASKGATVAFLISTPQTGVDSILVSASMLGLPFAIFKVIAAFITGLLGGCLVNYLTVHNEPSLPEQSNENAINSHTNRILTAIRYAVFDLLAAIDLWIIGGLIVAALITTLIPPDYFANQTWSQGIGGMLVVLAISIPLYVCTTGSVPIAASLIAAGMPLGTALVFLMAGPVTNVATIGSVYRTLGWQVLSIYLGTVISMSLLFGLTTGSILATVQPLHHYHAHGATFWAIAAALIVIGLLLFLSIRRIKARFMNQIVTAGETILKVEGMTCQHCAGRVKSALESCASVKEALPNLATGMVRVSGEQIDLETLIAAVERSGYKARFIA